MERKLAALPDVCGPEELAECVVYARRPSAGSGDESHLTDDEVAELVRRCHQASVGGGGRGSARFRVCAFSRPDAGRAVLRFEEPRPLIAGELRRLAPAVRTPDHALRVVSRDGDLVVDALLSAVRPTNRRHPEAGDFWLSGGRRSALIVAVEGPGALRVSERTARLRLAAGEVARLHPVDRVADRLGWFDRAAERIVDRLESEHRPDLLATTGIGEWVTRRTLTSVWSDVLSRTTILPRGGMLVFRPAGDWGDAIDFRYQNVQGGGLAASVFRYLDACVEAGAADEEEQRTAARTRVVAAENRLLDATSTLATLANVEGCVGVGPSLKVRGFGGEVTTSAEEASGSVLIPVAWGSGNQREAPREAGDDRRRERLAYRLCKAVPNTVAFVAARRGELAVFSSDDEHVHWTTDLSAIGRNVWGP